MKISFNYVSVDSEDQLGQTGYLIKNTLKEVCKVEFVILSLLTGLHQAPLTTDNFLWVWCVQCFFVIQTFTVTHGWVKHFETESYMSLTNSTHT